MSRTYNTPPSVLRMKMVELGRGLRNATKTLLLWPWSALKMSFESVLRIGSPTLDDRPQQFFGLGSITQDLLDKAERDRRFALQADPFEILARRPAAELDDEVSRSKPSFKKFQPVRHAEH